jgi:hypothetical protein
MNARIAPTCCSVHAGGVSRKPGAPVELWVKIRRRGRGFGGQPGDPARGARCGSCATRARRVESRGVVVAEPRAARQATAMPSSVLASTGRLQEFSSLDSGFGSAGGQVIAGRAGGRRVGKAALRPSRSPTRRQETRKPGACAGESGSAPLVKAGPPAERAGGNLVRPGVVSQVS